VDDIPVARLQAQLRLELEQRVDLDLGLRVCSLSLSVAALRRSFLVGGELRLRGGLLESLLGSSSVSTAAASSDWAFSMASSWGCGDSGTVTLSLRRKLMWWSGGWSSQLNSLRCPT